jgi:hypothetical protein
MLRPRPVLVRNSLATSPRKSTCSAVLRALKSVAVTVWMVAEMVVLLCYTAYPSVAGSLLLIATLASRVPVVNP